MPLSRCGSPLKTWPYFYAIFGPAAPALRDSVAGQWAWVGCSPGNILQEQVEMPQVLEDLMEVMVPAELEMPEDRMEEQLLSTTMELEQL